MIVGGGSRTGMSAPHKQIAPRYNQRYKTNAAWASHPSRIVLVDILARRFSTSILPWKEDF